MSAERSAPPPSTTARDTTARASLRCCARRDAKHRGNAWYWPSGPSLAELTPAGEETIDLVLFALASKSAFQNDARPLVAQAFGPANGRAGSSPPQRGCRVGTPALRLRYRSFETSSKESRGFRVMEPVGGTR